MQILRNLKAAAALSVLATASITSAQLAEPIYLSCTAGAQSYVIEAANVTHEGQKYAVLSLYDTETGNFRLTKGCSHALSRENQTSNRCSVSPNKLESSASIIMGGRTVYWGEAFWIDRVTGKFTVNAGGLDNFDTAGSCSKIEKPDPPKTKF